jgi:hypothetical protein
MKNSLTADFSKNEKLTENVKLDDFGVFERRTLVPVSTSAVGEFCIQKSVGDELRTKKILYVICSRPRGIEVNVIAIIYVSQFNALMGNNQNCQTP